MVAGHAAGKAGESRCQGRPSRAVRHVSIGRGGGAEGLVPKNTAPDR